MASHPAGARGAAVRPRRNAINIQRDAHGYRVRGVIRFDVTIRIGGPQLGGRLGGVRIAAGQPERRIEVQLGRDLGIGEFLEPPFLLVVEWPENIPGFLADYPTTFLQLSILPDHRHGIRTIDPLPGVPADR